MLHTSDRRVGVFIDVQNMYYSARNLFNRKVNFPNIVEQTVGDGKLIRAIGYTISTKGGEEEAFFEALRKSGIEVMSKELLEFHGGNKKGDWDVGITIDIVRMIDMLDVVVLVSGDGDFVALSDYVRSRGRLFHVASFRESTSSMLLECVDGYTNLSEDPATFLIGGGGRGGQRKQTKTVEEREEIDGLKVDSEELAKPDFESEKIVKATRTKQAPVKTKKPAAKKAPAKKRPIKKTAVKRVSKKTEAMADVSFLDAHDESMDAEDMEQNRTNRLTF